MLFRSKKDRFKYVELGRNKTLMMIFFNSSLRTRLSTQKAALNLGMNVIVPVSYTHLNKVSINGNDRLYENVVRRELRTRPGELFSREDLMRSMREIRQMGHFLSLIHI